jgi:protein arginine kinase activator
MPPHLCQTCKQNPATIHFTEIRNEEKRELHVCESCAQSQGIAAGPVMASLPTMLAHLVKGVKPSTTPAPRCPSCGISFAEFREKGRLGCPNDYDFFEEHLTPLLEKIHGATEHRGRLPQGSLDAAGKRNDLLLRLRRDLQVAVKGEQYEAAARLRDEIRRVEEAPAGAGPAGPTPPAPPAPRERRRRSAS